MKYSHYVLQNYIFNDKQEAIAVTDCLMNTVILSLCTCVGGAMHAMLTAVTSVTLLSYSHIGVWNVFNSDVHTQFKLRHNS